MCVCARAGVGSVGVDESFDDPFAKRKSHHSDGKAVRAESVSRVGVRAHARAVCAGDQERGESKERDRQEEQGRQESQVERRLGDDAKDKGRHRHDDDSDSDDDDDDDDD